MKNILLDTSIDYTSWDIDEVGSIEMTDDLVQRLRCYADLNDAVYHPWVYGEAADRIEKLEAALRDIIVHCEVPTPPNAEALKMFARKALEGEDE